MPIKLLVIMLLSGCMINCSKTNKPKSRITHDTIIVSGRPKNYQRYGYEKKTIVTLKFRYDNGEYLKMIKSELDPLFAINTDQLINIRLTGFKDTTKFYPITIKSDDLEIELINRDNGDYKIKFQKDTAKVECLLDCNYWWIYAWEKGTNEKPIIRECRDSLSLATVWFVKR